MIEKYTWHTGYADLLHERPDNSTANNLTRDPLVEVRRAPTGLALAVRPAWLAPGSTTRRWRVPRSETRSTVEAGGPARTMRVPARAYDLSLRDLCSPRRLRTLHAAGPSWRYGP